MSDNMVVLAPEELSDKERGWWQTTGILVDGRAVYDEEIEAINERAARLDALPRWAIDVRGAMPLYGFEMCGHRWLDGMEQLLTMLAEERYMPTPAGHCGDTPGWIVQAAEERAAAVEHWLSHTPPTDAVSRRVAAYLGEASTVKRAAAEGWVAIVRESLYGDGPRLAEREVATAWVQRAEDDAELAAIFDPKALIGILENNCGYRTIHYLDVILQMIGGDASRAGERWWICNSQLRWVFDEDPDRYEITRGYLWGLYAYLNGFGAAWLQQQHADCAGAALHALKVVSARPITPVRRWLVASLIKATKQWCETALNRAEDKKVAGRYRDLPMLIAPFS